jgi:hypothetical protein
MQWRLPYFLHVAVCLNSKLRQRQLGFDQALWIRALRVSLGRKSTEGNFEYILDVASFARPRLESCIL